MKITHFLSIIGAVALPLAGCAPFAIQTPAEMAEIPQEEYSNYNYRATTPEGVVISARQIRQSKDGDTPTASLDFWSDALKLRMRTMGGYALLGEEACKSADGTDGIRLEFGRDQYQKSYVYIIELFVTKKFIHVIEAGADSEQYEATREIVDEALRSYEVRR